MKEVIERERERLTRERETLQTQIDGIDRELAAIAAYEATKNGRAGGAPTMLRTRRGSRREAILNAVRENPAGLTRGVLLDRLGLKGDKSGEMAVSNALTALTKNGTLVRREGRYVLNGEPSREAA